MDYHAAVKKVRAGAKAGFPSNADTIDFARSMDGQDPIRHLRDEFIMPTKASLKKTALNGQIPNAAKQGTQAADEKSNGTNGTSNGTSSDDTAPAIYFCGNSLGLQPKAVREHIDAQLETWSSIGVGGHFRTMENSPLASWQDMAEDCVAKSAAMVGASKDEVVIMNSLTTNIHMMMASFYKPTKERHKVILEWKPFPSDTYAIASQIKWHGFNPSTSIVEVAPDHDPNSPKALYISTSSILRTIDEHASTTALILLPGLQYYSGQLFDIPTITAHARKHSITVGWDLAHAAGNVPLQLHDWDVDFAVWCTYKYINAGPGAIAGSFVHERHGSVTRRQENGSEDSASEEFDYRPRLSGWYGGDKSVRFNMDKTFQPTPGASGYQCSNPSALDLSALTGALSVFEKTSMDQLREKSLVLTAYAEHMLDLILAKRPGAFEVVTPRNPNERGAQLSVLLGKGLLETVGQRLKDAGVVCDQRKPDVIRVAPVPMYNSFEDVWRYMDVLARALDDAMA